MMTDNRFVIEGDAFKDLRADFNELLRNTTEKMIDRNIPIGEIAIKAVIEVKRELQNGVKILSPKIKYTVGSAVYERDKFNGVLCGGTELMQNEEGDGFTLNKLETDLFKG